MSVTYQLTEGEKWKRTLKVEVAHERVQEKFDATYAKLKSDAQIPGFRPGRAPLSIIKSRFGEMASQDVLEELLDESYREALDMASLDPISRPKITEIDFAEDKPLNYTAEFEVKPVVTLDRYTGFTLKKPDDQVKEGEIKELLEHIQRKNSSLESVDRAATKGDFVTADLEVISDSAGNIKEKKFDNVQLELVEGPVASQFEKQMQGVRTGEERDLEVTYPADHFDKRFSGSTVKFHARITAIKQLNLIEMNQEFFKQFDETITTLEQFKEKLRHDIQARKTKESNDALRDEVIKEVIDKNRFDLPESLLDRYLDTVVEDFRKQYKDKADETEIRNHYRPIGIRQIRWDILMTEIAKKENVSVEQQDIDAWLQRFADNYKMTLEQARKAVTENRKIADLKETILENKVIELITAGSTIETVYSPMVTPSE